MIEIFKIKPNGLYEFKEITGDLKSLQAEVGGLITLAPIFDELEERGIDIFADDEGLLKVKPQVSVVKVSKNKEIDYALYGSVIFCGHTEAGETVSLTEEQKNLIKKHFLQLGLVDDEGKHIKCCTFDFFMEGVTL